MLSDEFIFVHWLYVDLGISLWLNHQFKVVYREPVTGPRSLGSCTGSQLSIISWHLYLHLNLPINLTLTLL